MRNLHFTSPKKSVIALPCGMNLKDFSDYEGQIKKAMGSRSNAALDSLTPSEQQVIIDFRLWVESVNHKKWTADISNSAFTYFNCNTGNHVIIVAWCGYEDYAVDCMWNL